MVDATKLDTCYSNNWSIYQDKIQSDIYMNICKKFKISTKISEVVPKVNMSWLIVLTPGNNKNINWDNVD